MFFNNLNNFHINIITNEAKLLEKNIYKKIYTYKNIW